MWIPELVLTSEVWGRQEKNKYLYVLKKSFLETYGCERLKITENGQPLETGHTVIKGYMTADE